MKCAKARELISAHADGLVSPRVHEELSAHMADCESCAREYEMTTRMLSFAAELGNKKAPVDLWPVVQVRIEDMERSRRGIMNRVLGPVLRPLIALPAVAAAAAALVLVVQTMHPTPQSSHQPKSSEIAAYYQEYSEFRSKQSFGDNSGLIAVQLDRRMGNH